MTEQGVGFKRQLDAGGTAAAVYIPPAKRRQLQEEAAKRKLEEAQQESVKVEEEKDNGESSSSPPANDEGNAASAASSNTMEQRETWQDQRKVINGTINRLNAGTIKPLIQDLFQKANLVRLRGPLCKSILSASVSSPKYSDVYAALIAVINSKLPEVGELMVHRTILAFRRYYKQRDKASCQAVCLFLVHLFHQGVVHELIILQLLSVLLDGARPTDDAVEVAVHVLEAAGQALLEVSSAGVRACTERMRSLLHEGHLNQRVEYRVEELLKARKNGFKDFPSLDEELDLVERDDQITFDTSLDDEDIQKEEELDRFSFDPEYDEHEAEWKAIRAEILGEGDSSDSDDDSDSDSDDDDDSDDDSSDDDSNEEEEEASGENALVSASGDAAAKQVAVVEDLTEADLVNLRRTIYLTIMSSATFEECAHKLARIDVPPGRESELINMLIECCSQERTFLRYYGLIASRFCLLDDRWKDAFMESFVEQYNTIHRLETNKLRNVAKLFSHLLHTDSMPWSVMSVIHLNEDETTSSSRIFIKIVIQEMAEAMGIAKLKQRFETQDEEHKLWYAGMFPKDNVRNTRYAINFFTSIGLGPLTDDLREFLKNAPKLILAKAKEAAALAAAKKDEDSGDESSSVSSTSSSSSSSYSSSSSSSYTSSSSSSYSGSSSSSYSRGRRRGRSSRRGQSSRRRRRSYSSGSSASSYSSSSDDSSRSRSRGRRRKDSGRSKGRSRSRSPPKIISKEKDNDNRDVDRSRSASPSRSPASKSRRNSFKNRRRSRSRSSSNERSRSPPKRSTSSKEKDTRSRRRAASPNRSPSPRGRGKESNNIRRRSRSRSPPKIISSKDDDSKRNGRRSMSRSPSLSRSRSRSPPRNRSSNRSRNNRRRSRSRSSSVSRSASPSSSRSKSSGNRRQKDDRQKPHSDRRKRRDRRSHSRSVSRSRSRSPPAKRDSNEKARNRDRSKSRSPPRR